MVENPGGRPMVETGTSVKSSHYRAKGTIEPKSTRGLCLNYGNLMLEKFYFGKYMIENEGEKHFPIYARISMKAIHAARLWLNERQGHV